MSKNLFHILLLCESHNSANEGCQRIRYGIQVEQLYESTKRLPIYVINLFFEYLSFNVVVHKAVDSMRLECTKFVTAKQIL